jgi:hypothetical protein
MNAYECNAKKLPPPHSTRCGDASHDVVLVWLLTFLSVATKNRVESCPQQRRQKYLLVFINLSLVLVATYCRPISPVVIPSDDAKDTCWYYLISLLE